MTTTDFLLSAWNWHPAATAAGATALLAYVLVGRRNWRKPEARIPKPERTPKSEARMATAGEGDCPAGWPQKLLSAEIPSPSSRVSAFGFRSEFALQTPSGFSYFIAAVVVFILTLDSPLDALAEGYLFSAHMLQHLLLLLIVPLLLVLSWPRTSGPTRAWRGLGTAVEWVLNRRLLTWLAGLGAMWLWHAPALCNAAATSTGIRGLQIASLLMLGIMFWWPVFGPQLSRRLSPLGGGLYLFTACIGCTLLGIIITFAPVGVCSVYVHPTDRLGLLAMIRTGWGFSPAVDQQIGGLLMWVPACMIYLGAILTLLMRWFSDPGPENRASPATNIEPLYP